MGCFGPIPGYYSAEIGPNGKRSIVFDKRRAHSPTPLRIPCGKCAGCRLETSRQWAMRCLHEAKLHKNNVFATLTYDNDHLPEFGTLVKRDLQLFMKRLRKSRGAGVRFYACGEYGDENRRPHYHALLFNCDFPDKVFYSKNGRGDVYTTSRELRDLWPLGNNILGDVNFDTAAYVARYVMKKINGSIADDWYTVYNADGVCARRLTEFTVMSRRPGIASEYYSRFGSEVRTHDSIVINGREVRPARFYDLKYNSIDPEAFAALKIARRRKALLFKADNTSARRRVKEVLLLRRLHQLKRNV